MNNQVNRKVSQQRVKQAALALFSAPESDRLWVLEQLDETSRLLLSTALDELTARAQSTQYAHLLEGLSFGEMMQQLDHLESDLNESPTPWSSLTDRERLSRYSKEALHQHLSTLSPHFLAQVMNHLDWDGWIDYLQTLHKAERAELRALRTQAIEDQEEYSAITPATAELMKSLFFQKPCEGGEGKSGAGL